MSGPMAPPDLRAFRMTDASAWDAFVEHSPFGSFPQLWAWGELREPAGWRPLRIAVGPDPATPLAGAQVLIRQVPALGWRLGYVPRGPVGDLTDGPVREALFAALRSLGRNEGIATLKVDPQATPDDAYGQALLAPPWRSAAKVQPPRTRLIDLTLAAEAIGGLAGVPGRMERVDVGQPFEVVVDYAHTADSLGKVLRELRPLTRGRLIVVFGSAGERDRVKRPAMGRVAAELADVAVITDEDPRLEDARSINEEIAVGARAAGKRDGDDLFAIDDRPSAIAHAIGLAGEGDLILLAGKGHEQNIIYGTEWRPWDEKQVARQALRDAGYGRTDGSA